MRACPAKGFQTSVLRRRGDGWLAEIERVDQAVYDAIATASTPRLDHAMRRVSRAADYSRLSLTAAGVLALTGGPKGRRAAVDGLASALVTTVLVNLVFKPVGRRARPDRVVAAVPTDRHVRMPSSRSFPSGHSAAAVAFASGASSDLPAAALPLHLLAAVVSYSRLHTGVHFPGDVVVGALIGVTIANLTTSTHTQLASRRRR
jgi:membrane-associated phospholipid phosphatase